MTNKQPLPSLSPESVVAITQELAALRANPAAGWSERHPELYRFLQQTITNACSALGTPEPELVVTLTPPQSLQCLALLLTDGRRQIHVGADFLEGILLTAGTNAARLYAFRWVIAHEVGHLSDPEFLAFGRYHQARAMLKALFQVLPAALATAAVLAHFLGGVLPAQVYFMYALLTGALGAASWVGSVLLRRRFEYNADRLSLRAFDYVEIDPLKQVLEEMTSALRAHVIATNRPAKTTSAPSPAGTLKTRLDQAWASVQTQYQLARTFVTAPSVDKRVARLAQQTSSCP